MTKKQKQTAKENQTMEESVIMAQVPATANDLKSALLVVSLAINLVVLIVWLILQVTTRYDDQLAAMIFLR